MPSSFLAALARRRRSDTTPLAGALTLNAASLGLTSASFGARPTARFFGGRDQYPGITIPDAILTMFPGIVQPATYYDTTLLSTTGWTVVDTPSTGTAAAAIASAYSAAAGGANVVLRIPEGAALGNLDFTDRGAPGGGWIYVMPDATGMARVGAPGDAPAVLDAALRASATHPKLTPNAPNGAGQAITVRAGAYKLRFIGLHICQNDADLLTFLLVQSYYGCSDIIFDRCVGHGNDNIRSECRRFWYRSGLRVAAIDCALTNFRASGSDSQAILDAPGTKVAKVVNCILEAAGEPYMSGGVSFAATPDHSTASESTNRIPTDVEIRRNHLRKRPTWCWRHPQFAKQAPTIRGSGGTLVVNTFDSATGVLTLSSGTFDTTQTNTNAATSDFAIRRLVYVVSGPGAGGFGVISSYQSTTQVTVQVGTGGYAECQWLYGGFPGAGSVIEIREQARPTAKNGYEHKYVWRVLALGNVLENSWQGDDSQPYLIAFKTQPEPRGGSTNPGAGGRAYNAATDAPDLDIWTQDVLFLDNVAINVFGMVSIAKNQIQYPESGCPAPFGETRRVWVDNFLGTGIDPKIAPDGANYQVSAKCHDWRLTRVTLCGFSVRFMYGGSLGDAWSNIGFDNMIASASDANGVALIADSLGPGTVASVWNTITTGSVWTHFGMGRANTGWNARTTYPAASDVYDTNLSPAQPEYVTDHRRYDVLNGNYAQAGGSPFLAAGITGCDWPALVASTSGVRAASYPYADPTA